MEFLIAIPARRHSTRLPEKLLLSETGKPLLAHTISRALECSSASSEGADSASRVWVVMDDPALRAVADACNVSSVLTGEWNSGTERIVAALPSLPAVDCVVNLQADEPEMPANWVRACLSALASDPQAEVATIAVPVDDATTIGDPNVVKVVVDNADYALYFSRAAIPFVREGGRTPTPRGFQHVGLYVYRRSFLESCPRLPQSDLERAECLEQLRWLQAGARIKVVVRTDRELHIRGIDTADDYREFVERQKAPVAQ